MYRGKKPVVAVLSIHKGEYITVVKWLRHEQNYNYISEDLLFKSYKMLNKYHTKCEKISFVRKHLF